MEFLFIGFLAALALLIVFTIGWTVSTIILCLGAYLNGDSVRDQLDEMLEEW